MKESTSQITSQRETSNFESSEEDISLKIAEMNKQTRQVFVKKLIEYVYNFLKTIKGQEKSLFEQRNVHNGHKIQLFNLFNQQGEKFVEKVLPIEFSAVCDLILDFYAYSNETYISSPEEFIKSFDGMHKNNLETLKLGITLKGYGKII